MYKIHQKKKECDKNIKIQNLQKHSQITKKIKVKKSFTCWHKNSTKTINLIINRFERRTKTKYMQKKKKEKKRTPYFICTHDS